MAVIGGRANFTDVTGQGTQERNTCSRENASHIRKEHKKYETKKEMNGDEREETKLKKYI